MKNIKPSELILLGLHDLETVESMKDRFGIDMSNWHIQRDGKCFVCFAGAVMAITMNQPDDKFCLPQSFTDEKENLLLALNSFREGNIDLGLNFMKIPVPEGCQIWFDIPGYEYWPEGFKDAMRRLAKYLHTQGL